MKKHISLLLMVSLLVGQNSSIIAGINTNGEFDPRKWSLTTGWLSTMVGTSLAYLAGSKLGDKAFDYTEGRIPKWNANGFNRIGTACQNFLEEHPKNDWKSSTGLIAMPFVLYYLAKRTTMVKYWMAKNFYLHDNVLNHQIALHQAKTEADVIALFAKTVSPNGEDVFDTEFIRLEVISKLRDLRAKTTKGLSLLADIKKDLDPESLSADFISLENRAITAHQNIGAACGIMKLGSGYLSERNTVAHEQAANASQRSATANQINAGVNVGRFSLDFIRSLGRADFKAGTAKIGTAITTAGLSAVAFYKWAWPFLKCLA